MRLIANILVLLALLMLLTERWLRRGDHSLWLAVPVCAAWLPIHGTALMGMAVVGVATVAAGLERGRGRAPTARTLVRRLLPGRETGDPPPGQRPALCRAQRAPGSAAETGRPADLA